MDIIETRQPKFLLKYYIVKKILYVFIQLQILWEKYI